MLTVALLLTGGALLALALVERVLRPWPLTPAVVYLLLGIAAGLTVIEAPAPGELQAGAAALQGAVELALLVSLFAVGLRLRIRLRWDAWRDAVLLAGPGMLVAIVVGTALTVWLLDWPWPAACVLAAILAPTDPVLASEVQVDSENDRDAVRVSLTAEGALNDGTALPVVLAALWWLGAAEVPAFGDAVLQLLWPIAGGLLIGAAAGWLLGLAIRARARRGDPLVRDEGLTIGGVVLAYGLAQLTHTSAFLVAFALAVTLLQPLRRDPETPSESPLATRLHAFGERIERLVEAVAVMAIGVGLSDVAWSLPLVLLAAGSALIVRPLSVLAVVWPGSLPRHQHRLIAWFGIRGVGSLYYLAYVLAHGVAEALVAPLVHATLVVVAASIVLHGVSVTGAMQRYRSRVPRRR